jgi:hypothetical protein
MTNPYGNYDTYDDLLRGVGTYDDNSPFPADFVIPTKSGIARTGYRGGSKPEADFNVQGVAYFRQNVVSYKLMTHKPDTVEQVIMTCEGVNKMLRSLQNGPGPYKPHPKLGIKAGVDQEEDSRLVWSELDGADFWDVRGAISCLGAGISYSRRNNLHGPGNCFDLLTYGIIEHKNYWSRPAHDLSSTTSIPLGGDRSLTQQQMLEERGLRCGDVVGFTLAKQHIALPKGGKDHVFQMIPSILNVFEPLSSVRDVPTHFYPYGKVLDDLVPIRSKDDDLYNIEPEVKGKENLATNMVKLLVNTTTWS